MVALGALTMPFNGGATAFIIYGAAVLPFVSTNQWLIFGALGIELLIVIVEGLLIHFNTWQIFLNCFFTVVVGLTNFHFAQKARDNKKLLMQQEEIEALAAVAERERIARDLHDVLGHTLSVIVLKSELAGRLLDRELGAAQATQLSSGPEHSTLELSSRPERSNLELSSRPERSEVERPAVAPAHSQGSPTGNIQRARAELADVERTARTALAEVREAIGGYRARGLGAEIQAARETLTTAGVTMIAEGDLQPNGLTAAEETVLALALREAVTNIVRHAQATECRLRLVVEHGHHRLSIEDNGRHTASSEGNGLRGMRERVESLGGQLSLTRERGTHLVIELPQRAEATPKAPIYSPHLQTGPALEVQT